MVEKQNHRNRFLDRQLLKKQPQKHDHYLPLLPLKNVVMLPKTIIPIIVGRDFSIKAVEHALKKDKLIFISTQKDPAIESPNEDDIFTHGTRSIILQVMRMQNGSLKILAEGICRSRMAKSDTVNGFFGIYCDDLPTKNTKNSVELEAIWRHLKELYISYTNLDEKAPADLINKVLTGEEIDYASDTIAVHINLSLKNRQEILKIVDLKKRMIKLCTFLKKEIDILQTEQRIRGQVQTQVEKNQREYYLTEQIKAIQKELGREDQSAEIEKLQAKTKTIGLTADAQEKIEKELYRLEQMPPLSSEAVVSRHYVDWVLSLPWKNESKDTISLSQAERVLNNHHAHLSKAKERIIEFIATKKFSKTKKRSPIICLVGPPGVGKTSLAQSIAGTLGRKFVRISLGGIKDEAEIRGHRRTYIGALPGKIIQAMKRAGTINPVILLDEIDKMSQDIHGDPASAFLEVLDPEQNKSFVDHFLDTEYDLSKVMFITTANTYDGIPYPLFDRMEIISLSGYTDQEKIKIAKKFLIPKVLKEYELQSTQFTISSPIIQDIIGDYTREAGVRQLERILSKLMRKAIQIFLKDSNRKNVTVTPGRLLEWLGYPKFKKTSLNRKKERSGVAIGLAWTEVGGDVLEIEVSVLPGKGNLTLTGQLGEVMQESAQAALNYIRSRATDLGLRSSFYASKDIHLHLPEGATPKDGPSAGITICTALVSGLTGIPVKHDLAMTGEITLQGRILVVGGLKEKLLATKQHGIKQVIIPKENEDDLKELQKETDFGDLEIIFAEDMNQVLKQAFVKSPFKKKMAKDSK